MIHILEHCVTDTLKVLPLLFLSYILVEYIEHRMTSRTREMIFRAGKAGPVIGALVGMIPQCGFSAAAAGLFAGGVISPGTLLAVFLSTSDEMLPILLSERTPVSVILKILLIAALYYPTNHTGIKIILNCKMELLINTNYMGFLQWIKIMNLPRIMV